MAELGCKVCLEELTMEDGVEVTKGISEKITEIFPIDVSSTLNTHRSQPIFLI